MLLECGTWPNVPLLAEQVTKNMYNSHSIVSMVTAVS